MSQILPSIDISKSTFDHLEDAKADPTYEPHAVAESTDQQRLERKLRFKMDAIILPMSAIAYFLASMDRSDLANAAIAGLVKDLRISSQQYANIAGMFYVGYLILQLPSTLLIRKLTAPVQLFLAMVLWGTFTTCLVAARNYQTVIGLRVLIGSSESLLQGSLYFFAIIYKPRELAKRIAIIFSTSALAGACNGLIALGVEENLEGKSGFAAWQWIFLIEGVISIGFSFILLALYPSSPEKAKLYFNAKEKAFLIERSRQAQNTGESKFQPKFLLKLLLDPIFWCLVCIYAGLTFGLGSLTNFLPAIIKSFGWSSAHSQAMSVVVYASAWVTTNFWAFVSDRIGQRGLIISCNALIAVIGFVLLLTVESKAALLVGACITMSGLYPGISLTITWVPNLLVGHMYRAGGIALVNAFAQAVAISSNQAYRNPAHDYRYGNISSLCMTLFAGIMALVLKFWTSRLNKAKAERKDSSEAAEMRLCSIDELGYRHPDFHLPG